MRASDALALATFTLGIACAGSNMPAGTEDSPDNAGGAGGAVKPGGKGGAGGRRVDADAATSQPPSQAGGQGGGPDTTQDSGVGIPDAPLGNGADTAAVGSDAPLPPAGDCPAKLCDDFESYAANTMPGGAWTPNVRAGTLAVDETKAFSGSKSMRITNTGVANAKTFIELGKPVLPLPDNVVHGRLMFHLTKGPTGTNVHWEIVRGSGLLPGGARAQYNTGGEAAKFVNNYEPNDCTKYSKVPFPEKRWACFQWEFNGSTSAGGTRKSELRTWIDGTAIADIAITAPAGGCWQAPIFDTIHVGWQQYHAAQAVEIWIDDVAIDDKPIPCPTAPPTKP